MTLVDQALDLLRSDDTCMADARRFAPMGNSIVGSVLCLTHSAPRWATERAVCDALALIDGDSSASYRSYGQMSGAQHSYATYVAANPGCSIADVDRACRRNRLAGHKWVYDSVNRLIRHGVLRREWSGNRTRLYVVEG